VSVFLRKVVRLSLHPKLLINRHLGKEVRILSSPTRSSDAAVFTPTVEKPEMHDFANYKGMIQRVFARPGRLIPCAPEILEAPRRKQTVRAMGLLSCDLENLP
jgi:hypothetical protein